MDYIQCQVNKSELEADYDEVMIYVNGHDLINILRDVELPFAQAEGSPNIAGGYLGLPHQDVSLPSRHFLGNPTSPEHRYGQKVAVLDCTCGFPGCWPFLVKITEQDDQVIWSDFEQPHRQGQWTYEALKPFVFDRAQYQTALESLAQEIQTRSDTKDQS